MNNIVFSSWQGKIVDNRGLAPDKSAVVENIELPLDYDGYHSRAFIGWDGLVVMDASPDSAGPPSRASNSLQKPVNSPSADGGRIRGKRRS